MVELRRLRQFVVLADELHFGRAAKRLHMTQPPLTQAIIALERQLGAALFARTKRSVALTAAGQALLEQARPLLQAAQALPAQVQAAAAGQAGRLRLAFVSTIGYGPLPGWLRRFREAHPQVQLELREATLDVQLAAFAAGQIDAGFVLHAPGAAPAGFERLAVAAEPMLVALPSGHAAAARTRLKLADVAGEPLVLFPRAVTPSLHDAVLAAHGAGGTVPRVAQEATQMQTIVNLVAAGIGVAWVPETMTRLQRPGIVYRRVGGMRLRAETSLLWRAPAAPVVQRFVAVVGERGPGQRRQSPPRSAPV